MEYFSMLPWTLSAKIFLIAVKQYYETSIETEQQYHISNLYEKNYDKFLWTFRDWLSDYNFWEILITKDEFLLYSYIFRPKPKKNIKNLIDNDAGVLLYTKNEEEYYQKHLKKTIKESDIYRPYE